jgi:hypothetical protein
MCAGKGTAMDERSSSNFSASYRRKRSRNRLATGALTTILLAALSSAGLPSPAWASGTWQLVYSPNRGTQTNYLQSVSCGSATSCEAVGYYDNSSEVKRTLIESWNGEKWSVQSSPNLDTSDNELHSVSCSSVSSCAAVGETATETLIESWNGTSWSVVPSPNEGTLPYLYGVSCFGAASCEAVGTYWNGSNWLTLVESWNGTTWSVVPSPNEPSLYDDLLESVSCVSAISCNAAGYYSNVKTNVSRNLIESWSGSSWTISTAPNVGKGSNYLAGISCISATSCKAVGSARNSKNIGLNLIESLNGKNWSVVTSPNQGGHKNSLSDISCRGANSCHSVGSYYVGGTLKRTLSESWNGKVWSIVSSPDKGTQSNDLLGVSCPTTSFCNAVGSYDNSGNTPRTLDESLG